MTRPRKNEVPPRTEDKIRELCPVNVFLLRGRNSTPTSKAANHNPAVLAPSGRIASRNDRLFC